MDKLRPKVANLTEERTRTAFIGGQRDAGEGGQVAAVRTIRTARRTTQILKKI